MKILKRFKRPILIVLSFFLLVTTGCSSAIVKVKASDMMEGISSKNVSGKMPDDVFIDSRAYSAASIAREVRAQGLNIITEAGICGDIQLDRARVTVAEIIHYIDDFAAIVALNGIDV